MALHVWGLQPRTTLLGTPGDPLGSATAACGPVRSRRALPLPRHQLLPRPNAPIAKDGLARSRPGTRRRTPRRRRRRAPARLGRPPAQRASAPGPLAFPLPRNGAFRDKLGNAEQGGMCWGRHPAPPSLRSPSPPAGFRLPPANTPTLQLFLPPNHWGGEESGGSGSCCRPLGASLPAVAARGGGCAPPPTPPSPQALSTAAGCPWPGRPAGGGSWRGETPFGLESSGLGETMGLGGGGY